MSHRRRYRVPITIRDEKGDALFLREEALDRLVSHSLSAEASGASIEVMLVVHVWCLGELDQIRRQIETSLAQQLPGLLTDPELTAEMSEELVARLPQRSAVPRNQKAVFLSITFELDAESL